MSDGVTAPSVSHDGDLFPYENRRHDPEYHVEWVPNPPETTSLPIYIDLSIETEPGKTIPLVIFHNNQDMQFAEVSRVLGEKDVPRQVQQNIIANMSQLLGLGTCGYYYRVTIKFDAGSIDLNLVPDDEEEGSYNFDQMSIDNFLDGVTRPRVIDLNVEPGNDDCEIEYGDLLNHLDTTSWSFHLWTEVDNYYPIEDVQQMNNRDIEAANLQYHHQAPQYPQSSLADHDTENDLLFELVDFLEMEAGYGDMETDDDGNEDIYRTTMLESLDTYVATTIPASKSAIKEIEKVRLESVEAAKDAGLCVVCMEDFEAGVEATRLPCLHLYHGDCVVPWLEINHQCPLCRFPMPHR